MNSHTTTPLAEQGSIRTHTESSGTPVRDSLVDVLRTLFYWRKTILAVCLITAAGAVIITLMMPNYYRATTTFYPASPQLANPELIFGYTGSVTEYYGTDRDLDRIAEIANSNELADYMVNKFDLYTHYDIDSTSKKGAYKVRKRFRKLFSAQKNRYDAIEVSVEDTDPAFAAQMANEARDQINRLAQRLTKYSQAQLLQTFEESRTRKLIELDMLADSLRKIQARYNLYNVGVTGDYLSSQLSEAESQIVRLNAALEVLDNNPRVRRDTVEFIKANLKAFEKTRERLLSTDTSSRDLTLARFNQISAVISVLNDLHFQARKQLSYDMERYNQIKAAYNTDIQAIHVVETAETPLVKERPRRSILVLAAVLAAFVFSVLGVLIAENYRGVRWQEIVSPHQRVN